MQVRAETGRGLGMGWGKVGAGRRGGRGVGGVGAFDEGGEGGAGGAASIDFARLQNGSDVRGVASAEEECGIDWERSDEQCMNLTGEAATAIGAAYVEWLRDEQGGRGRWGGGGGGGAGVRVALGHDPRMSSESLMACLAQGMVSRGADVVQFGLATTPAMFTSTFTGLEALGGAAADAAVMITASHLPPDRNGMKFFTPEGGLGKADIADVLRRADQIHRGDYAFDADYEQGQVLAEDFMPVYAAQLVEGVRGAVEAATGVPNPRPLEGFHVVVDASNGSGGFFVQSVLRPLGAKTDGSQFLDPDGNFPHHAPNPENAEAMLSLRDAVVAVSADLGIIFDTDVDRSGAILADGTYLNKDRLIAALAAMALRQSPGATIVTDSVTSAGLTQFIADRGGRHHRFRRGYKNVIDEAVRLNEAGEDAPVAIETSGHGAFRENRWLDDGAYSATRLLAQLALNGSIGDLIKDLQEPAESFEFRLRVEAEDFVAQGEAVVAALGEVARGDGGMELGWDVEVPNYEGVRCNVRSSDSGEVVGWFLLRMSLHDPQLVLNIQADLPGGGLTIASTLLRQLYSVSSVDSSSLAAFVNPPSARPGDL